MPSPIEALRGNILTAFEQPNGQANADLIAATQNGVIDPTLAIDGQTRLPRAPRVIRPAHGAPFIELQLTHMELLWAFSYGWMVLYDEAVRRPMMDGTWRGNIEINSELKQRAAQLLEWASSLRTQYTPWPSHLPKPAGGANEAETQWCFKANNVFGTALSFMLYHEYAHVRQGHFDAHDRRDDNVGRLVAIDLEREADDFAFHAFVSPNDDEDTKALDAWPLLAALLSSLYLVNGLVGVFQQRHPHLHHRVRHMLARFDFRQQRYADYYSFLCACVLSVFANAHTRGDNDVLEPETFITTQDALDHELDFLDNEGERAGL